MGEGKERTRNLPLRDRGLGERNLSLASGSSAQTSVGPGVVAFVGQVLLPHLLSPSFTACKALFMQSLANSRPGWTLPARSLAFAHPETTQVSIPPSIWLLPCLDKWGHRLLMIWV